MNIGALTRGVKLVGEVTKILAILTLGIWTIYTFRSKREALIADARQKELALEIAREKKNAADLLGAHIQAKSVVRSDAGWNVVCGLRLTNKGGTDCTIVPDKKSIRLARVAFRSSSARMASPVLVDRQFGTIVTLPIDTPESGVATPSSLEVRSGADTEYLTFFHVASPGTYYLEFKVQYGSGVLVANAHFEVGEEPDPPPAPTPMAVTPPAAPEPRRP